MTKRVSISTPKNFPKIANIPITKNTSCNSATTAAIPNLQELVGLGTFRKEKAIYKTIDKLATAMAKSAFFFNSVPITGPTNSALLSSTFPYFSDNVFLIKFIFSCSRGLVLIMYVLSPEVII